jgi:hypothetical protein
MKKFYGFFLMHIILFAQVPIVETLVEQPYKVRVPRIVKPNTMGKIGSIGSAGGALNLVLLGTMLSDLLADKSHPSPQSFFPPQIKKWEQQLSAHSTSDEVVAVLGEIVRYYYYHHPEYRTVYEHLHDLIKRIQELQRQMEEEENAQNLEVLKRLYEMQSELQREFFERITKLTHWFLAFFNGEIEMATLNQNLASLTSKKSVLSHIKSEGVTGGVSGSSHSGENKKLSKPAQALYDLLMGEHPRHTGALEFFKDPKPHEKAWNEIKDLPEVQERMQEGQSYLEKIMGEIEAKADQKQHGILLNPIPDILKSLEQYRARQRSQTPISLEEAERRAMRDMRDRYQQSGSRGSFENFLRDPNNKRIYQRSVLQHEDDREIRVSPSAKIDYQLWARQEMEVLQRRWNANWKAVLELLSQHVSSEMPDNLYLIDREGLRNALLREARTEKERLEIKLRHWSDFETSTNFQDSYQADSRGNIIAINEAFVEPFRIPLYLDMLDNVNFSLENEESWETEVVYQGRRYSLISRYLCNEDEGIEAYTFFNNVIPTKEDVLRMEFADYPHQIALIYASQKLWLFDRFSTFNKARMMLESFLNHGRTYDTIQEEIQELHSGFKQDFEGLSAGILGNGLATINVLTKQEKSRLIYFAGVREDPTYWKRRDAQDGVLFSKVEDKVAEEDASRTPSQEEEDVPFSEDEAVWHAPQGEESGEEDVLFYRKDFLSTDENVFYHIGSLKQFESAEPLEITHQRIGRIHLTSVPMKAVFYDNQWVMSLPTPQDHQPSWIKVQRPDYTLLPKSAFDVRHLPQGDAHFLLLPDQGPYVIEVGFREDSKQDLVYPFDFLSVDPQKLKEAATFIGAIGARALGQRLERMAQHATQHPYTHNILIERVLHAIQNTAYMSEEQQERFEEFEGNPFAPYANFVDVQNGRFYWQWDMANSFLRDVLEFLGIPASLQRGFLASGMRDLKKADQRFHVIISSLHPHYKDRVVDASPIRTETLQTIEQDDLKPNKDHVVDGTPIETEEPQHENRQPISLEQEIKEERTIKKFLHSLLKLFSKNRIHIEDSTFEEPETPSEEAKRAEGEEFHIAEEEEFRMLQQVIEARVARLRATHETFVRYFQEKFLSEESSDPLPLRLNVSSYAVTLFIAVLRGEMPLDDFKIRYYNPYPPAIGSLGRKKPYPPNNITTLEGLFEFLKVLVEDSKLDLEEIGMDIARYDDSGQYYRHHPCYEDYVLMNLYKELLNDLETVMGHLDAETIRRYHDFLARRNQH